MFPVSDARAPSPHPKGQSYLTYASFSDPDGNGWLLQVTGRGSYEGIGRHHGPIDPPLCIWFHSHRASCIHGFGAHECHLGATSGEVSIPT